MCNRPLHACLVAGAGKSVHWTHVLYTRLVQVYLIHKGTDDVVPLSLLLVLEEADFSIFTATGCTRSRRALYTVPKAPAKQQPWIPVIFYDEGPCCTALASPMRCPYCKLQLQEKTRQDSMQMAVTQQPSVARGPWPWHRKGMPTRPQPPEGAIRLLVNGNSIGIYLPLPAQRQAPA